AFSRHRPVGPATVPSGHIVFGNPSCGPHLAVSQVGAVDGAGAGGRRQVERSQRSPAPQLASVVQLPLAGWQVHGPPQTSWPAQTTSSPALQLGVVQPQLRGSTIAPVVGSTVL